MITTDADKLVKKLEGNAKTLVKKIQNALQEWGNSTVISAKRNKPYKRRSGNLDKSQKAEVKGLAVKISIDPYLVTNKGYNYGAGLHDKDQWLLDEVNNRKEEIAKEIGKIIVGTL